ncbi:MAG: polyribonucleotide nucleotidyltransferase [Parcubacteria group bacterium]|nr:polyribonucleotide nucleotidyltransferase [Parcubacteria group bacterium]
MHQKKYEMTWGKKPLTIEVGKLAQQTNGSCVVSYGNTTVLATVVMSKEEREGMSYFPLMVDYEEKMYAAGRIKGSRFIKRETKPTDEAVLTGRLIDRAIRPLFDDSVRRDIQVVVTVLSIDEENDPDLPGMIGVVTALMISDIPWAGPIAGVRVGRVDGKLVLNPTYAELREKSDMNIYVAGDGQKTIMLEADAKEASEDDVYGAVAFGLAEMKGVLEFIAMIQKEIGKPKMKMERNHFFSDEEKNRAYKTVHAGFVSHVVSKTNEYLLDEAIRSKALRKSSLADIAKDAKEHLTRENVSEDFHGMLLGAVTEIIEERISAWILETGKRIDGRQADEIRPLSSEVGVLTRVHGSGLFQRGETQVLSVVTLGAPGDEQVLDGMEEQGKKHYMHHYNFPGFSVGEAKPFRGASRRDIGHGALAEKAMVPVLPDKKDFPYTIRVVSEVLSSNGSSSMASTCGSTLALMDAGVPLRKPVAGVAMGLVSDAAGKYRILTDLQDLEDNKGGMDFKITGTHDGITAIQMDTKTSGLAAHVVKETLHQARKARHEILQTIEICIPKARNDVSPFAPRITTLHINTDKIRDLIGPGGKVINEIIDKTGVSIDIEQDGTVFVTAKNSEASKDALGMIDAIIREAKVGEIHEGKVTRVMDFGAFVNIFGNKEGLVHISEFSYDRVNRIDDVAKVGDMLKVKVIEIDDQGRVNLSVKALLPPREGYRPQDDKRGFERKKRNFGDRKFPKKRF